MPDPDDRYKRRKTTCHAAVQCKNEATMVMDLKTKSPKGDLADRAVVKVLGTIGPVIIATITAALYLAGTVYNDLFLEHFGTPTGIIERSIQDNVVSGYFGLIEGLPIFVRAIGLIWAILVVVLASSIGAITALTLNRDRASKAYLKLQWLMRVGATLLWLGAAYVGFHIATVSAGSEANRRIALMEKAVASGCRECLIYRTRAGDLRGVVIGSDKARVVIVQRGGVRVVKTDELLAVLQPGRAQVKTTPLRH